MKDPIDVHDRPFVAIPVAVKIRGPERIKVNLPFGKRPAGPGIVGHCRSVEYFKDAIDAGIVYPAVDPLGL